MKTAVRFEYRYRGRTENGFFDKLSKTVTEASQKTMAKTMELADVARLNSMISDEERTISELYAQIGKLYRTLHQNDYEANFAGMIKAIIESEDKIDQYHSQILDIKGVQRCGNCGAEVLKGAAFCSACGAVMPEPQSKMTEETVTCRFCGAELEKGARFCAYCGHSIE